MNPCPCGFFGLADGRCTCTPRRVQAYRARLSGPLLDRFDMRVLLRPVPAEALLEEEDAEPTAAVRKRVLEARRIQRDRYAGSGFIPLNGRAPERSVRAAARLGDTERRFFLRLVAAHRLSARATRRLERVARTIADLEGEKRIRDVHLMEALGFRLGGEMEGRVEEELAAAVALRAKTQGARGTGEGGGVLPDPDPDPDPHPHP
jgi:magnesium chelatase family protein